MKPHEIMFCLNDIWEDESDGKPLENVDDDYILENSSSFSFDESENTVQIEIVRVPSQRRARGARARCGRSSADRGLPTILISSRIKTSLGLSKTFVSPDGTAWASVEAGSTLGRHRCQNVFKDRIGN